MKVEEKGLLPLQQALKKQDQTAQGFEALLKKELAAVDQAQKQANQKVLDLATGKNPDLAEVSLSLTQADLSFRLLLQVRNKLLEAYQEVMRMQL